MCSERPSHRPKRGMSIPRRSTARKLIKQTNTMQNMASQMMAMLAYYAMRGRKVQMQPMKKQYVGLVASSLTIRATCS
jgi:hypothetical protein